MDSNIIAIAVSLITAILFAYVGFKFSPKHAGLQLLFVLVALFLVWTGISLTGNYLAVGDPLLNSTTTYNYAECGNICNSTAVLMNTTTTENYTYVPSANANLFGSTLNMVIGGVIVFTIFYLIIIFFASVVNHIKGRKDDYDDSLGK